MGTVYAYVWSLLNCWHIQYSTCLLLDHLLSLCPSPLSLSHSLSHTCLWWTPSLTVHEYANVISFEKSHEIGSVALLFFYFFFFQYAICESLSWNVNEAFAVLMSRHSALFVPLLVSLLPLELNKGTGLSKNMHFWWFVLKLKDYEQDLSPQF